MNFGGIEFSDTSKAQPIKEKIGKISSKLRTFPLQKTSLGK